MRATAVADPSAPRAPRTLARVTNNPLHRASGNTPGGRRVRDLYRAYSLALGQPTDVITQAACMAAAEAVVIAEEARQRVLRGDVGVSYDDLVRLDHQADRKVRRLGLKIKNEPVADRPQPQVLAGFERP
jgi:hypothetical protein